jgi:Tol biopolymer transport system component
VGLLLRWGREMHRIWVVGIALAAVTLSGCAWVSRVGVSTSGVQPASGSTVGTDVSPDGRFVVFTSSSANLVPNDTNGRGDVFLRDNQTGTTELISVNTSGVAAVYGGLGGLVSADGRYVAFTSLSYDLVPNDYNYYDVFVRDRLLHTTTRVSLTNPGAEAGDSCYLQSMTPDGRTIVFTSLDDTLVGAGHDTNDSNDVFVRDLNAGTTTRISVKSGAGGEGDSDSNGGSISNDGRFVAFTSDASNLDVNDSGFSTDVFVRDRLLGTTTRITAVGADGEEVDSDSTNPVISGDGKVVIFQSDAANLTDPPDDDYAQVEVWAKVLGTTTYERISVPTSGYDSNGNSAVTGISDDGRFVLYQSSAKNQVPTALTAASNSFVRDRTNHTTALAGTNQEMKEPQGPTSALSGSVPNAISGDGRYLLFSTSATDMLAGTTDGNGSVQDVFLRSNPVPSIVAVSPNTIARGVSGTIKLLGSSFHGVGALALMGDGITVNGVTAVSETEVDVAVTVSPTAAVGPRTPVLVQVGTGVAGYTGGVVFLADGLTVR